MRQRGARGGSGGSGHGAGGGAAQWPSSTVTNRNRAQGSRPPSIGSRRPAGGGDGDGNDDGEDNRHSKRLCGGGGPQTHAPTGDGGEGQEGGEERMQSHPIVGARWGANPRKDRESAPLQEEHAHSGEDAEGGEPEGGEATTRAAGVTTTAVAAPAAAPAGPVRSTDEQGANDAAAPPAEATEVKAEEQEATAAATSNGHPPPAAIQQSEPVEITPEQAEMAAACQDHLRRLLDIAATVRTSACWVCHCFTTAVLHRSFWCVDAAL
jgi:hypothetical protein